MKSGLKIAFFGSSLVSAYWNSAATYYRGLLRAMSQRGHSITFYESDALDRQKHRDISDPSWARVVVYSAEKEDAVQQCLEEASEADLVVKASNVGAFDELLETEVLHLKSPTTSVVFWDFDAPVTLDRIAANSRDYFIPLVPQYDMVFTYGGGYPVVKGYKKFGARDCVPIYNALDPTVHFPVPANPKFNCDLAFLGNRLPDREARVEEFFLNAAEQLIRKNFILGGDGWNDKPLPRNMRYVGHVYVNDHNAFNCTPQAVLNISRESMARYGYSPATRVFEAAGAGACIITDDWQGVELFLEPNEEILVASSGSAVADCLLALTPQRARVIGAAAHRRVIAHHTYAHRAIQFEAVIDAHMGALSGAREWMV